MHKRIMPLLVVFITLCISAAEKHGGEHGGCSAHKMLGNWTGELELPGATLKIVFHVKEKSCGNFRATMDSPDQNAYDISVSKVIIQGDSLILVVNSINGVYRGKITESEEKIEGIWKQSGHSFDLLLNKGGNGDISEKKRPQEPEKPYPYIEEEVSFPGGADGVTLSGTLTLPDSAGKFPAVVLISGSGPQNRNEAVFGHKPFLIIADFLTENGIAVFRYDERGVGKSTGEYKGATSRDLAKDVKSAVDYLKKRKEIDNEKIGLLGHSEGGIIAPMIASENPDDIDFIVLLAAPGLPGENVLLAQTELISESEGINEEGIKKRVKLNKRLYSILKEGGNEGTLRKKLKNELSKGLKELGEDPAEEFINNQVEQLLSPWFKFFLTYDPAVALQEVQCPVLAIGGKKDLQVPADENLSAIEEALSKGGNKDYSIRKVDGLNHLLQEAETGSVMEYSNIEQTISPEVLKTTLNWIREKV